LHKKEKKMQFLFYQDLANYFFVILFTGVQPTINSFVIFLPGSGKLLSNFVYFFPQF
jgi:hypothetical protein